jgi:hypothetical protein
LPCIRIAIALSAVAVVAAGCAVGNNVASTQASSTQGEQPYKTMYGVTSEGPTTDLYTEFFGPSQPPAGTTVAAAQPTPSVTAQPIAPVQQNATATSQMRSGQTGNRTPQTSTAQPAPVQVAQQPTSPPPPEEPDVPTAYGITSKGPTTDLYTTLFGSR